MRVLFLPFALLILLTSACDDASTTKIDSIAVRPRTNAEVAQAVNASMSDAEILNALGLSMEDFDSEFVLGKDGTQTTYCNESQSIKILRSLVSGVTLTATGPSLAGHWHLGRHPDLPIEQ
jgi:predicted glycosyltransferase